MSDINWSLIHNGLAAEFAESDVKQRPGRGGQRYDYIDARALYDRLDAVVGPEAWSTSFRVIDPEAAAVECTLTIHGISKSDIGYPNSAGDADNDAMEPLKAAYSDSAKRAGVQWGIGRYLYHRGTVAAGGKPAEHERPRIVTPHKGEAEADRAARQRTVTSLVTELTRLRHPVSANDTTKFLDTQRNVADLCRSELGITTTLREASDADLERAQHWLSDQIKATPKPVGATP